MKSIVLRKTMHKVKYYHYFKVKTIYRILILCPLAIKLSNFKITRKIRYKKKKNFKNIRKKQMMFLKYIFFKN